MKQTLIDNRDLNRWRLLLVALLTVCIPIVRGDNCSYDNTPANTTGINSTVADSNTNGIPDAWEADHIPNWTTHNGAYDIATNGLTYLLNFNLGLDPGTGQPTFYVNCQTGRNQWDGLTPVLVNTHGPKQTIQSAVSNTTANEKIHVAAGTYYVPTLDTGSRTITLIPDGTVNIVTTSP